MNGGRLYSKEEMARISCADCSGCGDCCREMGDTVEIDPYDAFMLSFGLNTPFENLLGERIGLHPVNGLAIPYLKMTNAEVPSCVFLGQDGRCTIHTFRPGICRLFPLGRQYDGESVHYFILAGGCDRPQSKVKIERYIGIPDMELYEVFKIRWHRFTKKVEERLSESGDEDFRKRVSLLLLQKFYCESYIGKDFYEEFDRRLSQVNRLF